MLPNRLEKARWLGLSPKRRPEGRPRVGWAGAIGHQGDLELIAQRRRGDPRGGRLGVLRACARTRCARWSPSTTSGSPLVDYARTLASLDLDLAVAPLAPHPFNECKSNLRLLEYGVLGYPVLCTDILPYQGDLPVFRIANRPREWIRAIRELVADRAALRAGRRAAAPGGARRLDARRPSRRVAARLAAMTGIPIFGKSFGWLASLSDWLTARDALYDGNARDPRQPHKPPFSAIGGKRGILPVNPATNSASVRLLAGEGPVRLLRSIRRWRR